MPATPTRAASPQTTCVGAWTSTTPSPTNDVFKVLFEGLQGARHLGAEVYGKMGFATRHVISASGRGGLMIADCWFMIELRDLRRGAGGEWRWYPRLPIAG